MNIAFSYLYRDAGNYKNWGQVIFTNKENMPIDEIRIAIQQNLIDQQFFVAKDWRVQELFFDNHLSHQDHEWHEFDDVEFIKDFEANDCDITEFLKRIKKLSL